MKVRKLALRNDQAWLSIEDEEGCYLGTFHVTSKELADKLRQHGGEVKLKFVLE